MFRDKLHPGLGGGTDGVVVVQRGNEMWLWTLSRGNLTTRCESWRSGVWPASRIGVGDVSNALTCEATNEIPALRNLMVEG
jgi:hypothetical protein